MFTDPAATTLRMTDRKRLLGHLVKLGATDPERRAKAALAATELLQSKGMSWEALVPPGRGESGASLRHGWQGRALEMVNHPGITPDERAFVHKVAGWKSPGADGLARLRAIAERVGVEFR